MLIYKFIPCKAQIVAEANYMTFLCGFRCQSPSLSIMPIHVFFVANRRFVAESARLGASLSMDPFVADRTFRYRQSYKGPEFDH